MGYKVKGKPWEYQGSIDVSDCITSKEVMIKSGLDWNVSKCELVGKMPINLTGTDEELDKLAEEQKNGAHIYGKHIYRTCDNTYAVYRTDHNIPLGAVKAKYTPVQNTEAFTFFDDAIGKNAAIWQTAGFWGNGERLFVSAKLPETILVKGDPVENYLIFTNNHDGNGGVKILFSPIRVICQNILTATIKQNTGYVTFRHTNSVHKNINITKDILGISHKYATDLNQYYNELAKISVTDDEVINYVCTNVLTESEIELLFDTGHTFKQLYNRQSLAVTDSRISMRKLNIICDTIDYYFNGIGQKDIIGTAWGAVNSISGYYSNIDNIEGTKKLDSILYADKSKKIANAFELAFNV